MLGFVRKHTDGQGVDLVLNCVKTSESETSCVVCAKSVCFEIIGNRKMLIIILFKFFFYRREQ